MEKFAYIKKLPSGKYRVYSQNGKNMGTYPTREEAKKRLKDIHFFKSKKANGELVGPKFAEPIANLICLYGLHPTDSELIGFLELEGMEDFEELFKWALKELRKEAGESTPLSKLDVNIDDSELFMNLESIASFDMSALENIKSGDKFNFFKSEDTHLEILEIMDDKIVALLKSDSLPEDGHRVEYSKSDFYLWWMSGFFDRIESEPS